MMSELPKDFDTLRMRATITKRTCQRPPRTSKQKQAFAALYIAADAETKKLDPHELVTNEFLDTADDYEDELTAYELQNCVNYLLSSIDVCVCSNSFVVPADSYEIKELPRMWNTVSHTNKKKRCVPSNPFQRWRKDNL